MKNSRLAILSLFAASLISSPTWAHGDHIFFNTPKKMEIVKDEVTFTLLAAYSDIPEIHLSVQKENADSPQAEIFVPLNTESRSYSAALKVNDWEKGTYCAEVTQLGVVHSHETTVCFVVE